MSKNNIRINIPLVGILNVIVFLAFFFAKIFDKIDWSWFWVFSPLWITLVPVVICMLLAGFGFLFYYILILIEYLYKKWKKRK